MALHLRIQVRDYVIALLTGLTTSADRVSKTSPYLHELSELPCLIVRLGYEAIEMEHSLGSLNRTPMLIITAKTADAADPEGALGIMLTEVEVKMATDTGLGGLVDLATLASISDMDTEAEGASPISKQDISYQLNYLTNEGAPDVPI